MRLLVDTHLLLWAAARSRRLPKEARRLLESTRNEVHFSAAIDFGVVPWRRAMLSRVSPLRTV